MQHSHQNFSLFSQDEQEMPPLSEAMGQVLNNSFEAKTFELLGGGAHI